MKKLTLLVTTALISSQVMAAEPNETKQTINGLYDWLANGTVNGDIRYRYEVVDQENFTKDARASTLRTRLGYTTPAWNGFTGKIEFEDISHVGGESYEDGNNGKSQYPRIADPEGTEVNQVSLAYTGFDNTRIAFGRERLVLDNHRFIGDVGWRQNQQTFDGLFIKSTMIDDVQVNLAHIYNVNRIFGNNDQTGGTRGDFESDSQVVNIAYTGYEPLKITAYGYFLDFESDSPANSSDTLGVRLSGATDVGNGVKVLYTAEYATQDDAGENTNNYDADYILLEPGVKYEEFLLKIGYEELGSDNGTFAFRTPLATLHGHNGWADQFLNTPANGIEDTYIVAGYTFNDTPYVEKIDTKFTYHEFDANEGGQNYGSEWGVDVKAPFLEHYYVEGKYADFDADTGSGLNDRTVFWAQVGAKF